jgi:RNA exonuclease
MSKLFSHGLPTRASGEGNKLYDTMNTFLFGPLAKPKEKEKTKAKENGKGTL